VEEAALLMPVQRVIRGVQVENDLLGRRRMRLEEQVDEQPFDRRAVMADLVLARRPGGCVLEPVHVLLPASGAQFLRRAVSLPVSVASTGSKRS
jgi:hypothetical protein